MENQVVAEVHIVPLGTASPSLSTYIAACLRPLQQSKDVTYRLTAMGTVVQGPLRSILEIVRQMHEIPFEMGAARVYTSLTIDDRRDKPATMESKLRAVKQN